MNWLKDNLYLWIASIGFFACTRGSDEVNKTVRPDSQQFTTSVTDTFTVKTSTILFDSSLSNNSTRALIGSYYNSDFGKVTSNMYMQFLPSPREYKNTLGPNPKFDSLFLELYVTHSLKNPRKTAYTYGQADGIQSFIIRKVNQDISNTMLYFNNATFSAPDFLGSFQLSKSKLITITPNTSTGAIFNYIKIPLSNALGQELVDASGSFVFATQANFLAKFKGIFIESLAGNSCVWGIDSAVVKLKYHNYYAANNLKVNEEYAFTLSSIRTEVRNLTVDRSATPLAGLTKNYDEISLTDCYVQASTGVCTKISFPFLLDFKKQLGIDKLVINRAELVITPDLTNAGAYPVPTNLYFYEFDEKGKSIRNTNGLPSKKTTSSEGELTPSSIYYFAYNSHKNNYIIKQSNSDEEIRQITETVNITRFVQSIMDGKTSPNESLVLASDDRAFFRTVSTNQRALEQYAEVNQLKFKSNRDGIKLRIFYTPYP